MSPEQRTAEWQPTGLWQVLYSDGRVDPSGRPLVWCETYREDEARYYQSTCPGGGTLFREWRRIEQEFRPVDTAGRDHTGLLLCPHCGGDVWSDGVGSRCVGQSSRRPLRGCGARWDANGRPVQPQPREDRPATGDVAYDLAARGIPVTIEPYSAADDWVELTADNAPNHLADLVGGVSTSYRCTGCGRKSWDLSAAGGRCGMTQPDGAACQGVFR